MNKKIDALRKRMLSALCDAHNDGVELVFGSDAFLFGSVAPCGCLVGCCLADLSYDELQTYRQGTPSPLRLFAKRFGVSVRQASLIERGFETGAAHEEYSALGAYFRAFARDFDASYPS